MVPARKYGFAARAAALTLLLRIVYSALGAVFIRISAPGDDWRARVNVLWQTSTPADGWRYLVLGPWQRFDALWYEHIASAGYDQAQATSFYPLYPMFMRGLHAVLPFLPLILCGLVISTVAAFFFFWGFQKLADAELGAMAATWGLILYCAWPTGFILFSVYAEALLLALMVWSIWFGRRNEWWTAGLLGFLAGMTKATGSLVAIPLAFFAWRGQRNWRSLPALLPLLAYPSYQLWLRISGFPSAADIYRQHWHASVGMPWTTLIRAMWGFAARPDWVVGASVISVLLVLAGSFFLRREYAVFCWCSIAFFLLKNTEPTLQGANIRYCLAAFPVFMWAGLRSHLLVVPLATFFLILNVACLYLSIHWVLVV